jgi:hypothetical protein
MASGWSNSASHILANEGSYADFLEKLLSDEIQARRERTKSALYTFWIKRQKNGYCPQLQPV